MRGSATKQQLMSAVHSITQHLVDPQLSSHKIHLVLANTDGKSYTRTSASIVIIVSKAGSGAGSSLELTAAHIVEADTGTAITAVLHATRSYTSI